MFLTTFEILAKQEIQQIVCDYRIKWEALEDKEVRKQFVSSISSKFRQLSDVPRTSRRNGCCSDQQSFHQLLKVVGKNGLDWLAVVKKEHFGETKTLKKLFEQRTMRSRPCYRTDRHLIGNPRTLRHEKRQLRQ